MTPLLIAVALAAGYPPAPPPPPEKPLGAAPYFLVASVENDKLLVQRTRFVPVFVEKTIAIQVGEKTEIRKVVEQSIRTEMVMETYLLSGVKAFDGAGKEIDKKALAERLKKAGPVVVSSDGQPVDARLLQLFKTEAIVLVGDALKNNPTSAPIEKKPIKEPIPPRPTPPPPPGAAVKPQIEQITVVVEADEPKKAEEPKGKEVKFEAHEGHFVKNSSGLKGNTSFLALNDAKMFTDIFGIGRVMGPKPNFVEAKTFESKLVVAAIQRGNAVVTYKVDKVTDDDGVLYIAYTATKGDASPSAKYASTLVVSVDKGKYKSVVFLENGKKAGTAEFPKEK